jgi:hypothetical protein
MADTTQEKYDRLHDLVVQFVEEIKRSTTSAENSSIADKYQRVLGSEAYLETGSTVDFGSEPPCPPICSKKLATEMKLGKEPAKQLERLRDIANSLVIHARKAVPPSELPASSAPPPDSPAVSSATAAINANPTVQIAAPGASSPLTNAKLATNYLETINSESYMTTGTVSGKPNCPPVCN